MSCDHNKCDRDRCDHDRCDLDFDRNRCGSENPFLKGLGFGLGFGLGSSFSDGCRPFRGFDSPGCFDECRPFRGFDISRFFRGCGPCGFRRWFW